jgi:hypothetical protein
MPVSQAELRQAAELKRRLIQFTLGPECDERLKWEIAKYETLNGVDLQQEDEAMLADLVDTFIFQHKFEENKTVMDLFIAATPDLSDDDRKLAESWKDYVEGVFAVQRRAEDTLITTNLVDELSYNIRSNQPGGTRHFLPGMYMVARIVPVADEWMISGSVVEIPAIDRQEAYITALNYATTRPELVFRNPALRERGWESQTTQRNLFIKCFGADQLIISPEDYVDTIRSFSRFVAKEVTPDGAEPAPGSPILSDEDEIGVEPPDWIDDVESVGLIFDEKAGTMALPDYAMLVKAFETPELTRESPYKDAVLEYVEEVAIPSTAFRRLATADPASASKVLQIAYEDPDLTWENDGERLLRDNRGGIDDVPTSPSAVVVSENLVKYAYGDEPVRLPARRLPGRNDPCPCGSGQKYKRCCGR